MSLEYVDKGQLRFNLFVNIPEEQAGRVGANAKKFLRLATLPACARTLAAGQEVLKWSRPEQSAVQNTYGCKHCTRILRATNRCAKKTRLQAAAATQLPANFRAWDFRACPRQRPQAAPQGPVVTTTLLGALHECWNFHHWREKTAPACDCSCRAAAVHGSS